MQRSCAISDLIRVDARAVKTAGARTDTPASLALPDALSRVSQRDRTQSVTEGAR